MESEKRLNPDILLAAIQQDERNAMRGRLKIFLGMAAGVGKTYAMLKEAQQIKQESHGVAADLVVGIVDTHGRQETAVLLDGLAIIPEKIIRYKDRDFKELDIDEIIARHPQLVLVDELAHANIPGSRHEKRWQDVIELLDHGINVYTTLNVQHIESLNDVVAGITEIHVRETVPDTILEMAATIQLIDLTPDGLLQRLQEGKVYLGDQAYVAAQHFFQKDRLTALREIVLRYTAEKVDRDLRHMTTTTERSQWWKPREKLLVAIGPSPHSQKLIRITRRLASNLNAPWIAVYVDSGRFLDESENNLLAKNLELARDLGAEVITLFNPDIADAIAHLAHNRGITQIIVGRPPGASFFRMFRGPSILDRLATECSDVDMHMIKSDRPTFYRKKLPRFNAYGGAYEYFSVAIGVGALFCLCWWLAPLVGSQIIGLIFLLVVLGASVLFRQGPALFATVLSVCAWNFLFINAHLLDVILWKDCLASFLYCATALSTSILVSFSRRHRTMLIRREESISVLYDIMKQIALGGASVDSVLKAVKDRLERGLGGTVAILVKDQDNRLLITGTLHLLNNEKERSAALWAFDNGKEAGWSTNTLPSVQSLYTPLRGFHDAMGVLVYKPKTNTKILSLEEKNFIYTVCQQLGHYLERFLFKS